MDEATNGFNNLDKSIGDSSSTSTSQHPNHINSSFQDTISTIQGSPFPQTSGIEFEKPISYATGSSVAGKVGLKRTERSESPEIPPKIPCNFMTQDVIEATIQCLIAQAEECQRNNMDTKTSEKLILEEFGRCLVEIIEFSTSTNE